MSVKKKEKREKYRKRATLTTNADIPPLWIIMLYIAADSNLANFAIESLKQLNGTAGPDVRVVVQFAVDAPGGQKIPRFLFDKKSEGESIKNSIVGYLDAPKNMTEEEALTDFLQWAYKSYEAPNYALILWGHGPELLFQPPSGRIANGPCGDPGDDSQGLYITPIELRNALQAGIPQKDGDTDPTKKPRIISMDACSMSMFEVAYEIRNYAEFMVASQEEVPDLSFPYDKLVDYFRAAKSDAEYLCKSSVEGYGRAYQDYIFNMNTGMKNVTLSAIRLRNLGDLETALKSLADALYDARDEKGLPGLLIDARERSMGYAGGLYVDICNFCDKLQSALAIPPFPSEIAGKLKDACNAVCKALRDEKGCILTNQATDSSESHGLSIYFPYMKDEEIEEVREPLVKGGTDTIGKGFTAVMNRAASNVLLCVRRQLIVDTEGYYGQLNLAKDTNWYRFIVQVWSRILAGSAGHELDLRYSAQQSAVNLLKEDDS